MRGKEGKRKETQHNTSLQTRERKTRQNKKSQQKIQIENKQTIEKEQRKHKATQTNSRMVVSVAHPDFIVEDVLPADVLAVGDAPRVILVTHPGLPLHPGTPHQRHHQHHHHRHTPAPHCCHLCTPAVRLNQVSVIQCQFGAPVAYLNWPCLQVSSLLHQVFMSLFCWNYQTEYG